VYHVEVDVRAAGSFGITFAGSPWPTLQREFDFTSPSGKNVRHRPVEPAVLGPGVPLATLSRLLDSATRG
jgi:hypothetical protein